MNLILTPLVLLNVLSAAFGTVLSAPLDRPLDQQVAAEGPAYIHEVENRSMLHQAPA